MVNLRLFLSLELFANNSCIFWFYFESEMFLLDKIWLDKFYYGIEVNNLWFYKELLQYLKKNLIKRINYVFKY